MKDLLAPDETVISPYYMRQLLQYGIKLGEAQNTDMSPEGLLREAEVGIFMKISMDIASHIFFVPSVSSPNSKQSNHNPLGHLEFPCIHSLVYRHLIGFRGLTI